MDAVSIAEQVSGKLYSDGLKLNSMDKKLGSLDTELNYSNYLLGDIEKLSNKRKRLCSIAFGAILICIIFLLSRRFVDKIHN